MERVVESLHAVSQALLLLRLWNALHVALRVEEEDSSESDRDEETYESRDPFGDLITDEWLPDPIDPVQAAVEEERRQEERRQQEAAVHAAQAAAARAAAEREEQERRGSVCGHKCEHRKRGRCGFTVARAARPAPG